MIGTMRVSSFQSRLVNRSFYFAQELISLSNLPYRLLVGRNYFLPSTFGFQPNDKHKHKRSSSSYLCCVNTVKNRDGNGMRSTFSATMGTAERVCAVQG